MSRKNQSHRKRVRADSALARAAERETLSEDEREARDAKRRDDYNKKKARHA